MSGEGQGQIVVASDVHIGSQNADVDAFNMFLDDCYEACHAGDHLVLLGDIFDFVRQDPDTYRQAYRDTITLLEDLGDTIPVYYVSGNHDRHPDLLELDNISCYTDDIVLDSGEDRIRFRHGDAFDRFQLDALEQPLTLIGRTVGDIDPTRGRKDPFVRKAKELSQYMSGETYPARERRAHRYLDTIPEEKLVYGHTHDAYVHPDNVAANPGSWKVTKDVHNTYLTIEDGHITLHQYHADGEDEPIAKYV